MPILGYPLKTGPTTNNRERQAPAWRVSVLINIAKQGLGVPSHSFKTVPA